MVCNGNQGTYFTKDRNTAASANQAKSSHKLSLVSIIAKRLKHFLKIIKEIEKASKHTTILTTTDKGSELLRPPRVSSGWWFLNRR